MKKQNKKNGNVVEVYTKIIRVFADVENYNEFKYLINQKTTMEDLIDYAISHDIETYEQLLIADVVCRCGSESVRIGGMDDDEFTEKVNNILIGNGHDPKRCIVLEIK